MTIYRGPGGTGEARTDSDITEVRIIADEAEGYKNDAAASASAAASSASAAATAETNAETAEANAETAEANAEAAQAAAEAAQAAAEAVYDDFDDRYLGAKSSNPSVDNDGDALTAGALYFNTTVPEMRVYTGSAWTGLSASSGVASFNTRTGAVTLTDTDVNTALGYTAANNSSVLLKANNLSDLTSASTARTNLGLGTAATTASTAYATAAQGTNADTAYGWGNHASAGYAADNAVVKLTGDQTVAGTKTFSSTITGSVSGNAGTVTNGVYTSGSYANPSWITSLAETKVLPSQTSNSGKYLTTDGTTTSWATVSAGVTSVSGTAPISSSGGTTPAISISQANSTTNGFLSSTDWNTFNGKGSGTVTSVSGTGSASGLSLSGTVTSSGSLTLSGTVNSLASGTYSINISGSSTSCSGNSATATALSTASGSAPSYSARAWVNFNGTGTVAIRASGNVSSITDIGVGRYQVNLTTALPDTNYSILATIQQNGTNNNQRIYEASTITKTTSAYGLACDDGLAYSDFSSVYSTVFR